MAREQLGGAEGKVESYEDIYTKALAVAQAMSHKWKDLPPGDVRRDPLWILHGGRFVDFVARPYPSKDGKTGMQRFFEARVKSIEEHGKDAEVGMILIRRLLIELEDYQKEMDRIITDPRYR